MVREQEMREANRAHWHEAYAQLEPFLKYPAGWVIRFHNRYLRHHVPSGRVLDYGCGSANNALYFIENGYETYGVDISETIMPMVKANLERMNFDPALAERFSVIDADATELPYESGSFDFILANQVLYYLASEEQIRRICKEFSRLLRPGGVVFFTMMGKKNYYINHFAKAIHQDGKVYEIQIDREAHRLQGFHEMIYLVKDSDDMNDLFSEFECIGNGHFELSMLDGLTGHHWIYAGKKQT